MVRCHERPRGRRCATRKRPSPQRRTAPALAAVRAVAVARQARRSCCLSLLDARSAAPDRRGAGGLARSGLAGETGYCGFQAPGAGAVGCTRARALHAFRSRLAGIAGSALGARLVAAAIGGAPMTIEADL